MRKVERRRRGKREKGRKEGEDDAERGWGGAGEGGRRKRGGEREEGREDEKGRHLEGEGKGGEKRGWGEK